MIRSLSIASDGYLCKHNTLSIATNGYLCIPEPIIPVEEDKTVKESGDEGSSKYRKPQKMYNRSTAIKEEEDKEILLILKCFVQCQN